MRLTTRCERVYRSAMRKYLRGGDLFIDEGAGTFHARPAKMGYVQDERRLGLCVNGSGILSEFAAGNSGRDAFEDTTYGA